MHVNGIDKQKNRKIKTKIFFRDSQSKKLESMASLMPSINIFQSTLSGIGDNKFKFAENFELELHNDCLVDLYPMISTGYSSPKIREP